jgi:lyso-ornithine lipid O-acyltransferase
MRRIRAALTLAGFTALTVPLIPVQAVLNRMGSHAKRRLPQWYHARVCALLGIRIKVTGTVAAGPVLLVANHTSWLDIPVLSTLAPLSFVAKSEIAGWPFIGTLAQLQRSVFVDRSARGQSGQQAAAIANRLAAGEAIVLFAEGTSSDGNRVLPFKSTLLAAAFGQSADGSPPGDITVQTIAIAYTRLHGLPLGRALRPSVAWYGDMPATSHAWHVLGLGPLDVEIRIGPPQTAAKLGNRKAMARTLQTAISDDVRLLLRGSRSTR